MRTFLGPKLRASECALILCPFLPFRAFVSSRYVLQHIMGHNLCLDVFGDHSTGEAPPQPPMDPDAHLLRDSVLNRTKFLAPVQTSQSGLAFHGEAGQAPHTYMNEAPLHMMLYDAPPTHMHDASLICICR